MTGNGSKDEDDDDRDAGVGVERRTATTATTMTTTATTATNVPDDDDEKDVLTRLTADVGKTTLSTGNTDDDAPTEDGGGGAFVVFVSGKQERQTTSRSGGKGGGGRCKRRSEEVAMSALGCEVLHEYGKGFLAATPSAWVHECEDSGMVSVFVGKLDNLSEMARDADLPSDANPAHVVTQLRATSGHHFLDELRGKWAFCMLHPQRNAVFAAVDSQGTHAIYRGRGCEGGVVVLHSPAGNGFVPRDCQSLDVFLDLQKIPAGSFISGNRHISPHRYVSMRSDENIMDSFAYDAHHDTHKSHQQKQHMSQVDE